MANAAPHHQSSLEGLIEFSTQQPLYFADATVRERAIARFQRIVSRFEATDRPSEYNRPALIRLTFEYARSPESQDRFLTFFFQSLALDILDNSDLDEETYANLREPLFTMAEFLMANFFLPLRASTNKTPLPSPSHQAALQHVLSHDEQQRLQDFVGTPERLSALRATCLVRDRHRCVITRAFDEAEAMKRLEGQGPHVDDDGNPFTESDDFEFLQVAHIIPYSLTKVEQQDGTIDEAKQAAIAILNMFDHGVVHLVEGTDMNRPYNAITLSNKMHQFFGQYKIFFERMPDIPHTYRIGTFLPPLLSRRFPMTRTLLVHPTIDPPSERLLALHCAIAHILRLSGAGDYINKILRDREDGIVRQDGSTPLGILVNLALQAR